jgi:hypothetical protein
MYVPPEKTHIYGLYEIPENENDPHIYRYIGKADNVSIRFRDHINDRHINLDTNKKNVWLTDAMDNRNVKIGVDILETIEFDKWEDQEDYWYRKYINNELTNDPSKIGRGHKPNKKTIHRKYPRQKRPRKYDITYDECRAWVKDLDIRTSPLWHQFIKTDAFPKHIPRDPEGYYKGYGWKGWQHFLSQEYLSLEEAKEYIKKYNFKSHREYRKYWDENKYFSRLLPPRPFEFYKDCGRGLKDWEEFSGINKEKRYKNISNMTKERYMTYEEACLFVRANNIYLEKEYDKFIKDNPHIKLPDSPQYTYKNIGWVDFPTFLNTNFLSYIEAINFLNPLKLKTVKEYQKYIRANNITNLPLDARSCYKCYKNKTDFSWDIYLSRAEYNYLSPKELFEVLNYFNITTPDEYKELQNEYPDMLKVYPDEVSEYIDIFNGSKYTSAKYLPYDIAKLLVKFLVNKSVYNDDFIILNRQRFCLPINPRPHYSLLDRGWISWDDFLSRD